MSDEKIEVGYRHIGTMGGGSRCIFLAFLVAFLLGSVGCANPAMQTASLTFPKEVTTVEAQPVAGGSSSFAGSWQSCTGAQSPELCSRYLLLQRGKRICGTWSYFASGDSYDGRVVAELVSPVEARRTRICGRPGSETGTQCEVGWEVINRPMQLCGGKLGDLDGKAGGCLADFERVESADPLLDALAAQPWIEECLSGKRETGQ